MITTDDNEEISVLSEIESYLGTPRAQKILQILVCWETMPVKEIITKSGLSESQVHTTLRNLERIGTINHESRGIYRLSSNEFTQLLKKAYLVVINQVIGQKLHDLSKNLDELPPDEVSDRLI